MFSKISRITLNTIEYHLNLLSQQTQLCFPWQGSGGLCITSPVGAAGATGNFSNLGTIILSLMPYIFAVSGVILLFMIVASGYGLLTSAGNPDAVAKAKSRLTAAVTGFFIVFAAFWIFQLVGLLLATSFAP